MTIQFGETHYEENDDFRIIVEEIHNIETLHTKGETQWKTTNVTRKMNTVKFVN